MSTIKPFFDLGVDFLDSGDRDLFWKSFESSITLHDNELFHFILERRENDKVHTNRFTEYDYISIGNINVFIFALKLALLSFNYYVIKYILENQIKSEIVKSSNWAEGTILNHALYVLSISDSILTNQSPPDLISLSRAYGRKVEVENSQDWHDMKHTWLNQERIKILLYIINYDPQVNTPMKAKSYYLTSPFTRDEPYPIFPLHQELTSNFSFHLGENTQILTELLNRGANPNVQTSKGFTPLHYCSVKKEVELLLSVGANPELKNEWGVTARESQEWLKSVQPFNIPSPFDGID